MNEPSVLLNDGRRAPMMAFGTGTAWFKDVENLGNFDSELVEMTKNAIKAGFRHIDCAEMYNNEEEVGVAIADCGVPREQLYITTKVAGGIKDIPKALNASLKKLKLDYVDLYLIHEPWELHELSDYQTAWQAMIDLKAAGKAKSIGVSDMSRKDMEAILHGATELPVVNQIEYHPYIQRSTYGELFVPWLQDQGIQVAAFKSISPAVRDPEGPLMPAISRIAGKYHTTTAVVLLRWCLQQNIIPVTTTKSRARLQEYASVLKVELTTEEMEEITKVGGTIFKRWYFPERYDHDDRS